VLARLSSGESFDPIEIKLSPLQTPVRSLQLCRPVMPSIKASGWALSIGVVTG
jgi:hypothetical protein